MQAHNYSPTCKTICFPSLTMQIAAIKHSLLTVIFVVIATGVPYIGATLYNRRLVDNSRLRSASFVC